MKIDINDYQDPLKMEFLMSVKAEMEGLEIQRTRISDILSKYLVHDAGYYMIILRRIYREIEKKSAQDSRVANLKGKYKNLCKKIKMRDHFEHKAKSNAQADKQLLTRLGIINKEVSGNIRIHCSVIKNSDSIFIVSEDLEWDMAKDHQTFIQMVDGYINLYPFNPNGNTLSKKKKKHLRIAP